MEIRIYFEDKQNLMADWMWGVRNERNYYMYGSFLFAYFFFTDSAERMEKSSVYGRSSLVVWESLSTPMFDQPTLNYTTQHPLSLFLLCFSLQHG
jgi:hypothetical protein